VYEIGGLEVTVTDGVPTLAGGGSLAGSTLTMDTAFRNIVQNCGFGVLEAVAATATRPAELLGLGNVTGRIADGYAADLVLLDESLHPNAVMKGGAWV
jgi:N-acetylglucosamine-6-phosphate deacetylase